MDDQTTSRESGSSVKPRRWRWPRISIWELLVAAWLLYWSIEKAIYFPKYWGGSPVVCVMLLCIYLWMKARVDSDQQK
jgi:hypothetical protein